MDWFSEDETKEGMIRCFTLFNTIVSDPALSWAFEKLYILALPGGCIEMEDGSEHPVTDEALGMLFRGCCKKVMEKNTVTAEPLPI